MGIVIPFQARGTPRMSGWIKVEKDLANDPRVLRMASRLSHADVTQPVTLSSRSRLVIVGALVTLWWYADTHIGDDDVLAIGPDEIDELVGLQGFCTLMPPDWLQVLDSEHVKLIDYTAHNGSIAKTRALAQRRQERHRVKPASTSRSRHGGVTQGALPDKTRQDKNKNIGQRPSAFDRFWSAYPKKRKRKTAEQIWERKALDPRTDELIADVERRKSEDRRWVGGYVPDPPTYLNGERWNDELETVMRPRVEGL